MIAFTLSFWTVNAYGNEYDAYDMNHLELKTHADEQRERHGKEESHDVFNLTTSTAERGTSSALDQNTTRKYTRRVTDSFFILPYVVVLEFV